MPLQPGTSIGPYRVVALLGAGGMGEVYRAHDSRLHRDVAVKVLHPELIRDPELLRRFEQEARTIGSLSHPNLLALFDVGSHDDSPYLVTELLRGQTLRQRLAGPPPLSPRQALQYALQIAQGLAAAHRQGVIHRDLKPENLFLTEDDQVKILDFGLAKLQARHSVASPDRGHDTTAAEPRNVSTMPGIVMGTAGYMSPEQVRGQMLDHRSDIFSFGVVLYEMLTGRCPFVGESAIDTMQAILRDEPPDVSESQANVSPALERLLRRCLEKDPGQRFDSARDLAFALEALGSGRVSGQRSGTQPAASSRRTGWLLPALASLTAVLALAASFAVGRRVAVTPIPTFQRITFRQGQIQSARFTPDGQNVVYSADWDGTGQRLYTSRLGRPEFRRLDLPPAELSAISSNGELAFLLGENGITSLTLGQAGFVGGGWREVATGTLRADWSPDGSSLAVVRAVLREEHLEYPAGRTLLKIPGNITAIRVSPDGERVAASIHSTVTEDRIEVVDRSGQSTVVAEKYIDIQGLAWSPDGKEVWFAGSETGEANVLWAASLSGRRRVLSRPPGSLVLFDVARDGRVLVSQVDNLTEIYCRPKGSPTERELSWLNASRLVDLSADGQHLLLDDRDDGGSRIAYLRPTDGSPAVRVGAGSARGLSPDAKWVGISESRTSPLRLLPVGAGQSRSLPAIHGLVYRAAWLPDGNRLIATARPEGREGRHYLVHLTGNTVMPLTPEGISLEDGARPSPDGTRLAWMDRLGKGSITRLEGLASEPVKNWVKPERLAGWSADSRHLLLYNAREQTLKVSALDPATGKRTLWRELGARNPAGVRRGTGRVVVARDGESYAYSFQRSLSKLYLMEGLR